MPAEACGLGVMKYSCSEVMQLSYAVSAVVCVFC